jgi:hypothetical protein
MAMAECDFDFAHNVAHGNCGMTDWLHLRLRGAARLMYESVGSPWGELWEGAQAQGTSIGYK